VGLRVKPAMTYVGGAHNAPLVVFSGIFCWYKPKTAGKTILYIKLKLRLDIRRCVHDEQQG